jgi:hypothetical protein
MKAHLGDTDEILLNKLSFIFILGDCDPTKRIETIIKKSFDFDYASMVVGMCGIEPSEIPPEGFDKDELCKNFNKNKELVGEISSKALSHCI